MPKYTKEQGEDIWRQIQEECDKMEKEWHEAYDYRIRDFFGSQSIRIRIEDEDSLAKALADYIYSKVPGVMRKDLYMMETDTFLILGKDYTSLSSGLMKVECMFPELLNYVLNLVVGEKR